MQACAWLKHLPSPRMKSIGRDRALIEEETIRPLKNYDTDVMIRVLALNEKRLYHWLVLHSITVVQEDLDRAVEYVRALREVIKAERPGYVSPYEPLLPI